MTQREVTLGPKQLTLFDDALAPGAAVDPPTDPFSEEALDRGTFDLLTVTVLFPA